MQLSFSTSSNSLSCSPTRLLDKIIWSLVRNCNRLSAYVLLAHPIIGTRNTWLLPKIATLELLKIWQPVNWREPKKTCSHVTPHISRLLHVLKWGKEEGKEAGKGAAVFGNSHIQENDCLYVKLVMSKSH